MGAFGVARRYRTTMEFEYRARTADGKTVSARIEAVNEQAVIETLGSKDMVLV